MAKSTSFSESNISIENNTSSLTINIWFSAQNSTTWFGSATLYCTCNGSTQSAAVSHSKGGAVSASFTFHNIKHNEDGSKSVSWSWSCATGTGGLGTQSDSGTKVLTIIPRGSTINDFTDYFNFGEPLTIGISKKIDTYYDVLEIGFIEDDTTNFYLLNTIENVVDGYEWIQTEDELNAIYNNTPNRDFRTITFRLTTYTDNSKSTQIGNTSENSNVGMIINANPSFTNFSYEDINDRTIALTGSSSKIVNGYSTLRISNLICNANKGAILQLIQINDNQYEYTDNFTIDLEKWNNNKITIYVIDSRNNSTKLEVLIGINFINYKEKVIANKSCLREGSINEESILSFNGTWFNSSFGAVDNTLTASYKYKETGNDEWIDGTTNLELTISNSKYSYENYIKGNTDLGFSTDKSYDIQIIITDLLGNKSTTTILVAGEPAMDIYKSNVAFGGIYDESESQYQSQFKKPVKFNDKVAGIFPVGYIYMSVDPTNPSELFGGTWEQIKDTFLLACGDNYDAGTTGGESEVTLTIDEMPSHTHTYTRSRLFYAEAAGQNAIGYGSNAGTAITAGTNSTGGGLAHNNMPPYLAVYVWVRVEDKISVTNKTLNYVNEDLENKDIEVIEETLTINNSELVTLEEGVMSFE